MTVKCDSVAAFVVEWKKCLYTGTGSRYSPVNKVSPVASLITTTATQITKEAHETSKRQRRCCCIEWCHAIDTKLMCVPPFPPPIDNNASKPRQRTYAKKAFKQREYLERLGWQRLSKENEKGDLRFCINHGLEEIIKYVPVKFFDGSSESTKYIFMAPTQAGKKVLSVPHL